MVSRIAIACVVASLAATNINAEFINFSGVDAGMLTSTGQAFPWTGTDGSSGTVHVKVMTSPTHFTAGYPSTTAWNLLTVDGTSLADGFDRSPETANAVHEYLLTFDQPVDILVRNAETLDVGEQQRLVSNGSVWAGGFVQNGSLGSLVGLGTQTVDLLRPTVESPLHPFAELTTSNVTELRWSHINPKSVPTGSGEAIGIDVLRAVPEPSTVVLAVLGVGCVVFSNRRRSFSL